MPIAAERRERKGGTSAKIPRPPQMGSRTQRVASLFLREAQWGIERFAHVRRRHDGALCSCGEDATVAQEQGVGEDGDNFLDVVRHENKRRCAAPGTEPLDESQK